MAVLSDGNPSHDYGTATLRGVAERIFPPPPARTATADLVDIQRLAPGIRVELAYRTSRNITGRRLPGYCENKGLLLASAARDLARVQRHLRRRGLGLLVVDAYRPSRASRALVRWAERSGRADLVGTYIARRSRHNTGSAVDLTLVRARDGRRLPMGSSFDDLSPRAHTLNARGRALRNRLILERAMERFGWGGYWREWWHFEHERPGSRYLDVPIGCERG
jgi:D-alanyl-D-alanine dipeptidase